MYEAQRTAPRRTHRKSRTGCLQCKQRKVKCDESKPICTNCIGHGISCSYLQIQPLKINLAVAQRAPSLGVTTSSLEPSIPSQPHSNLPVNFTILDLELLHFWTTSSAFNFTNLPSGANLFRITFIEIALEHPFLMYEILSLSALHLAHVRPSKSDLYRNTAVTHYTTALSLFQPQIANLTPENCHACFAFSTIVSIHAWASQSPNDTPSLFASESTEESNFVQLAWVKLHRGSYAVIRAAWPWIEAGPLSSMFKPWKGLDTFPLPPLDPIERKHLDDLAEAWNTPFAHQIPVPAERKEVLETTLQSLRRVFSLSNYRPEISRYAAALSWINLIPEEFVQLLEERVPEALLLMAHYCVLLKRLEDMWWVEGKAEKLLETVRAALGDGWERWLQWPINEVIRTDIVNRK